MMNDRKTDERTIEVGDILALTRYSHQPNETSSRYTVTRVFERDGRIRFDVNTNDGYPCNNNTHETFWGLYKKFKISNWKEKVMKNV